MMRPLHSLLIIFVLIQTATVNSTTQTADAQKTLSEFDVARALNVTRRQNLKKMHTRTPKQWTFLSNIAAKNNLRYFAIQNMRQMVKVGSNNNINIVLQVDGIDGNKINRYFIEKGESVLLDSFESDETIASGTPSSQTAFLKWGIEAYPSTYVAINFWNHGSGIKDPSIWGRFVTSHRSDIFTLNPLSKLFELNRRVMRRGASTHQSTRRLLLTQKIIPSSSKSKTRGIAFNDDQEYYIDNQQLHRILEYTSHELLGGKRIDIVFMDACFMGMVEIASKMAPYVDYMVGSPEVSPGTGYNYELLLAPFTQQTLTPKQFAQTAVYAYEKHYANTHTDYTQTAVDLSLFSAVEDAFEALSKTLQNALLRPDGAKIFDLVRSVRFSAKYTTEFYDPDYIDAGQFLAALSFKAKSFLTENPNLEFDQKATLVLISQCSEDCFRALRKCIIAEIHDKMMPTVYGLGLFFPKRHVHTSYTKTSFDKKMRWSEFLTSFINYSYHGKAKF